MIKDGTVNCLPDGPGNGFTGVPHMRIAVGDRRLLEALTNVLTSDRPLEMIVRRLRERAALRDY